MKSLNLLRHAEHSAEKTIEYRFREVEASQTHRDSSGKTLRMT